MSEVTPTYRTGGPTVAAITPPPGVYPGVPNHVYHNQWQAASNSRLTKLHRSPAHLRAYLDGEREETAALVMGRAIHTAILEPDDFENRYVKAPELDRRTKEGKATWADLELRFGPGFVLRANDYKVATAARDAVLAHRSASAIVRGTRVVELSLRWNDADTGIACKARPDCHTPEILDGVVWDIKTTKDASPRAFERAVYEHGYHRQAAFYLDGLAALGLPAAHFLIAAVEKEPPFAVVVYRLTEGAIEAAREQIRTLLRRYAHCLERNEWPGYGDDIIDIALPHFAWGQIDEEVSAADAAGDSQ